MEHGILSRGRVPGLKGDFWALETARPIHDDEHADSVVTNKRNARSSLQGALDALAEDGWEVVDIFNPDGFGHETRILMRRTPFGGTPPA